MVQNERNWSSSDWQHRITTELKRDGLDVEILSPSNKVIFDSVEQHGHQHWMSTEQVAVMDNGSGVPEAQIFKM